MSSPIDRFRSPFLRHPWVRVKNASTTAIPPHSVVLITGATKTNKEMVYTVRQPNAANTDFNWGGYLITGPLAIGASTDYEGVASRASTPCLAAYDSGTPAVGQVFGPRHGQFTLSQYYYGFLVVGTTTTSLTGQNVMPVVWQGIPSLVGKIDDTDVTLGSTCTVSVHVGSSYQTDSTMNVTAINRGVALTSVSGSYCKVSAPNGVGILDWVAC